MISSSRSTTFQRRSGRSREIACAVVMRRRPVEGTGAGRSAGCHLAVTSMAELLDQPWMGWTPIELVLSPLGRGALIQQQHLGEVIAQACASLVIGAWDGSRSADRNGGCLGELGHGRVQSIGDDVAAPSRVAFQYAPEDLRQIRDVEGVPVLLSGAEHDQVAVVVSR